MEGHPPLADRQERVLETVAGPDLRKLGGRGEFLAIRRSGDMPRRWRLPEGPAVEPSRGPVGS